MNQGPEVFFAFLFILLAVILLAGVFVPTKEITASYFDGEVVAIVEHNNLFTTDRVVFVFSQPGDYIVTIEGVTKNDESPNGFIIGVTEIEIPETKVVERWSINDIRITITRKDVSESHEFIY